MLKIERAEVQGWEASIRGMRNPLNSWEKSDTVFFDDCGVLRVPRIGPNDLGLMKRLYHAGTDHRKFMRMLTVYVDITAPLYWWKEFDTYKVGTVANSCSTMHTIHKRPLTLDDFSHEKLNPLFALPALENSIHAMNFYRERYLETKDKDDWMQIIQLLHTSYNQKRTIALNYEVLANIYHSRRNHKLDEWHVLCEWIETLPYFKEVVLDAAH